MAYLLGIDGGTESVRAMLFDLDGRPKGSHVVPYDTDFPKPGWAEQSPDDWWTCLAESVRGALTAASITGDQVIAMAVDTTCCSVVAVGADDRPLRPAMIWMDVRSAQEAALVAQTHDPALRINGDGRGPVSAEWMIPKSLWMKRHQPELFARAARICEFQDYINFCLTGRWVASLANVSARWHYQSRDGGLPTALLQTLGLPELADKWPQVIVRPGDVIDGLSKAAAAQLGLNAGMPVVQAGADAFVGIVGLGVTEPGEMAMITGSSHLHLGIATRPVHAPGVWGTYMDAVYPGKPIIEGGQTSTGSVVAWFKRHFAEATSYDVLNAQAATIAPGSEGLLVLDHFQGNRTPYTDALSRGAITGLTLKHTPAHVYRAIIEGVCLGTKLIVENFGDAFQARRIVVCGGATRSPLWLQIHADTLGVPLELTEVPDAPSLGCAILAAHGAGRFKTIEDGARAMVRTTRVIEPNVADAARYDELLPRYRELYASLKRVRDT
jgi:FGGY-family pentulose kinase